MYFCKRISFNMEEYINQQDFDLILSKIKHFLAIGINTYPIRLMHIAQSSVTATPSFPSSFDTKTLTLSVKARGLIALVHLCPYYRCMSFSPQARCRT